MRAESLLVLLAASACGGVAEDEPRTRCRDRWIGSPDGVPEIVSIAAGGADVGDVIDREPLADGRDGLRLSIRGRHLHACAVAVAVTLRGPDGEVRGGGFIELADRGDGWGIPAWDTDLAYLPLPASAGGHVLSVIVEDAAGRRAVLERSFTVR